MRSALGGRGLKSIDGIMGVSLSPNKNEWFHRHKKSLAFQKVGVFHFIFYRFSHETTFVATLKCLKGMTLGSYMGSCSETPTTLHYADRHSLIIFHLYYTKYIFSVCVGVHIFGLCITALITDIIQLSTGYHAPYFLTVCKPNYTILNTTCDDGAFIVEDICSGSDSVAINVGRLESQISVLQAIKYNYLKVLKWPIN